MIEVQIDNGTVNREKSFRFFFFYRLHEYRALAHSHTILYHTRWKADFDSVHEFTSVILTHPPTQQDFSILPTLSIPYLLACPLDTTSLVSLSRLSSSNGVSKARLPDRDISGCIKEQKQAQEEKLPQDDSLSTGTMLALSYLPKHLY